MYRKENRDKIASRRTTGVRVVRCAEALDRLRRIRTTRDLRHGIARVVVMERSLAKAGSVT